MTDQPVSVYIVAAAADPGDHELIKEAVRSCHKNHIVSSVYNGRQLMDLLRHRGFYAHEDKRLPDAILLSFDMPLMDGLTALEKLKGSEAFRHITVCMIGDEHGGEKAGRALEVGAAECF